MKNTFDVIVVGGGHAGVEAATASARIGAKTALITQRISSIGEMSCNPAIGGLGKGHLVREVDALDGLMGRAADQSGIQFRLLNRSKGPAVRGPRAQADRRLYKAAIQHELSLQTNLEIIEADITSLLLSDRVVTGVRSIGGEEIKAAAVVLTTGTFLNGLIHLGSRRVPAGRYGDKPAKGISDQLKTFGLRIGRLKTGTPARLDGRSIHWSLLEEQKGDDCPTPFSFRTNAIDVPQVSCFITETNPRSHETIRGNLHLSPVYSGQIEGKGPRYCPSIEDKVSRFADKESHQVFLEPEGLDDQTVYPNGISTALPEPVQECFLRQLRGLEDVVIKRYGYAIEYDYIDPTELGQDLQLKALRGLFLAGQINGTTGYEEAAAQGIVAGINAARSAGGLPPEVFDRASSYIGVLIDDLTTKGVSEPYRMFTSRAEYRLSLRADNADMRLTPKGMSLGVVGSGRQSDYKRRAAALTAALQSCRSLALTPSEAAKMGIRLNLDGIRRTALDLLAQPDVNWDRLTEIWPVLKSIPPSIVETIEAEALYSGYLGKQQADAALLRKDEFTPLPASLDYSSMPGLSTELRSKLSRVRPGTLGQASRIDGMTPAALVIVLHHARLKEQRQSL